MRKIISVILAALCIVFSACKDDSKKLRVIQKYQKPKLERSNEKLSATLAFKKCTYLCTKAGFSPF